LISKSTFGTCGDAFIKTILEKDRAYMTEDVRLFMMANSQEDDKRIPRKCELTRAWKRKIYFSSVPLYYLVSST
jgi:hypothetical protein